MKFLRRNAFSHKTTLARWLRAGQPMPPTEAYEKVRAFTASLLPMAGYDLRPLLRPDNIVLTEAALVLRSTKVSRSSAKNPPAFPGFTPPECYPAVAPPAAGGATGQAQPASAVYTVGAVLAALLRGHPPPPANTRPADGFPLFLNPTELEKIANFSTEPDPFRRPANLSDFYELLAHSRQRIYLDYK